RGFRRALHAAARAPAAAAHAGGGVERCDHGGAAARGERRSGGAVPRGCRRADALRRTRREHVRAREHGTRSRDHGVGGDAWCRSDRTVDIRPGWCAAVPDRQRRGQGRTHEHAARAAREHAQCRGEHGGGVGSAANGGDRLNDAVVVTPGEGGIMNANEQLRDTVMDELAWDMALDASAVGVAAQDGVVTLMGHVRSYAEKRAAEKAARRVRGVVAIANEIEVRPPGPMRRDDIDIATQAARVLRWTVGVPVGITAAVSNGWVTLEGTVRSSAQRRAAERAVRDLVG